MDNKVSSPIIREPKQCGKDKNLEIGREPTQTGWYKFACEFISSDMSVLDVGAGLCYGMEILRQYAGTVKGIDNDKRLTGLDKDLSICELNEVEGNSFDFVVCIDVIEHIIEDLEFMRQARRVSKKYIIVTTPNYQNSNCRNKYHCREYTVQQFIDIFKPWKTYVGSEKCIEPPVEVDSKLIKQDKIWEHICGVFK